jgi:UDPglucose 6-dehydrogenase
VDHDPRKLEVLRGGGVPIYEPGLEELVRRNVAEGRLHFAGQAAEAVPGAEVAFIAVGTPPGEIGDADLSYVLAAAESIGRALSGYCVVVNKSTVPVGSADLVRERLATVTQQPFDVVSNPEFLKEGDAVGDFLKPDRVVVGTENVRTAELLKALYGPFARSRDKVIVMSVRSAEMTKYAANCMLATKISFINEVSNICERVGADVRDVRMGIGSDSRIGYQFIYPGMGYGGSCFPKDVKALIDTSRQHDFEPQLLASVDEVNNRQKHVLSRKVLNYFEPQGGVKGKTLAIWGLAFKANTDDVREAAAFELIRDLTAKGMKIRCFDPVAGPNTRKEFEGNALVEVLEEQYAVLDGASALAVVTEWNQFRNPDFDRIKKTLKAPLIFDGRNLYSPSLLGEMGFAYFCIGRRDPK